MFTFRGHVHAYEFTRSPFLKQTACSSGLQRLAAAGSVAPDAARRAKSSCANHSRESLTARVLSCSVDLGGELQSFLHCWPAAQGKPKSASGDRNRRVAQAAEMAASPFYSQGATPPQLLTS